MSAASVSTIIQFIIPAGYLLTVVVFCPYFVLCVWLTSQDLSYDYTGIMEITYFLIEYSFIRSDLSDLKKLGSVNPALSANMCGP